MKELSRAQILERSITKRFKSTIWTKFITALKQYELVNDGDKIAVCISGGKDSWLMALLFKMLKKYSETKFEVIYLCMNPGYAETNLKQIQENAMLFDIDLQIFETDIFDSVVNIEKSPCYLCARMRRGHLYNEAKKRGCNKIALGHHFSDVIETTLMGMLYGAQLQAMPPKLKSQNFEGMELIRPLYCVNEKDIISWKEANGLKFLQCACRFTENCNLSEEEISPSARLETKKLIKELSKSIPDVEMHIFRSIHNVNLDTFVGYKHNGTEHSFLEKFEKNVEQ
ncbi:MAG: tRNA 2-thiocytidine biosynthesis protein TtcA [Clostridia bacterium]|nr:tRNA 2-thiocytidine biosynthesis protein TtcA [Clostridia bacterium]